MTDWRQRLTTRLEPVLEATDPRPAISTYHDMPFAIFHYPPSEEFPLRGELSLMRTRLEQKGKKITTISLAERLQAALSEEFSLEQQIEAERSLGIEVTIETVHEVLSQYRPLDALVAGAVPSPCEPTRDLCFIVRVGALFPFYRTFSLLEQLKGKISVPTVLFYPGELDGPAGLRFMGVLDAEHNYRPKIF
jgi:bacteriophage exclusion system BrxB-like protein